MPKGRIRNTKNIVIDGIRFKSKLEGYCYEQLKANGIPFKYEEDIFTLINPFTFNNSSWELGKIKGVRVFREANPKIRAITYKPDFTNLEQGWVIECKGMMTDTFPMRWKLFKRYIQENGLNYDLYMPRNKKHIDIVINLINEKSNRSSRE